MANPVSPMKQSRTLKQNGKNRFSGDSFSPKNAQIRKLNYSSSSFPRMLKIERQKACAFVQIREGANGAYDVIQQMKRIVRNASVFDEGFATYVVKKILIDNGLTSHSNPRVILQTVYKFVTNRIKYISDVRGIESINTPRETISIGYGDCDDQAILVAAMLSVLGFEPQFVVAKSYRLEREAKGENYHSVKPADYNHIYTRVLLPAKAYYLDTTLEDGVFDSEASSIFEKRSIKIWNDGENPYLEGIGDFFKSLGKGVLAVATPLAGFIPVVGGLAQKGLGTLNALANKPQISFNDLATETNKVLDELIQAVYAGADYSEAVKQGEAVVNNFIGLKNNKGKKQDAAANEKYLASVTIKLNQLRALDKFWNDEQNAKNNPSASLTANDSSSPVNIAGVQVNSTALIIGGVVVGGIVLYMVTNK